MQNAESFQPHSTKEITLPLSPGDPDPRGGGGGAERAGRICPWGDVELRRFFEPCPFGGLFRRDMWPLVDIDLSPTAKQENKSQLHKKLGTDEQTVDIILYGRYCTISYKSAHAKVHFHIVKTVVIMHVILNF